MDVHFKPETETRLHELASASGRPTDDLVEDAMAGYLAEVSEIRQMLDSRYDDIKSGRVKPIDGEEFFESLRRREEALLSTERHDELRPGLSSSSGSGTTIYGPI